MKALGDLRVLDLADEKSEYCSKLLAQMGAEVVLVEKPGGSPTRSLGPFLNDLPHPEKSLHFFYFNSNKKSITLNLQTRDGVEIFKKLATKVDVILETFPPGKMRALGLGYETLKTLTPGLILASISGFGQTGPYKDYACSDLIAQAMGGLLFISGNPSEPPARLPGSMAFLQASVNAAMAIMIAVFQRDQFGEGQWIDISAQEAMAMTLEGIPYDYYFNGQIHGRRGGKAGAPRGIFPCKDGYIACNASHMGWEALAEWLMEEGAAEDLAEAQWRDPQKREKELEHVNRVLQDFFRDRTKQDLYHSAQRRRIPFCPVNTPEDVLQSEQLKARNFFISVDYPELGRKLTGPGTPFRFSEDRSRDEKRAPLIGEHNREVYEGWLGISLSELETLRTGGII